MQQQWPETARELSTPPVLQLVGAALGTGGLLCAPPAALALVSLRVGDADRACHCAISSVANAAEVSMRSAACITSCAWSR